MTIQVNLTDVFLRVVNWVTKKEGRVDAAFLKQYLDLDNAVYAVVGGNEYDLTPGQIVSFASPFNVGEISIIDRLVAGRTTKVHYSALVPFIAAEEQSNVGGLGSDWAFQTGVLTAPVANHITVSVDAASKNVYLGNGTGLTLSLIVAPTRSGNVGTIDASSLSTIAAALPVTEAAAALYVEGGAARQGPMSAFKILPSGPGAVRRTLADLLSDWTSAANYGQTWTTVTATLRTTVGDKAEQRVFASGLTSANDGDGGVFIWDPASALADDGYSVIQPFFSTVAALANGRWLRLRTVKIATSAPSVAPGASGLMHVDRVGKRLWVSTSNVTVQDWTEVTLNPITSSMTIVPTQTGQYSVTSGRNETIPVNSTGGSFNVLLPPGVDRQRVRLLDVTGATATNPVTLMPSSGQNVLGSPDGAALDDGTALAVYFDAASTNWIEDVSAS